MDNLNLEELKQLSVFYKQKSNDLELSVLQNQLLVNRFTVDNKNLENEIVSLKNLNEELENYLSAEKTKVAELEKDNKNLIETINFHKSKNRTKGKTKSKK